MVKRDHAGIVSINDCVGHVLVWYGMVEVCEGAPVAVSGWVLTDRHDVRPCARMYTRTLVGESFRRNEHASPSIPIGMTWYGMEMYELKRLSFFLIRS